MSNNNFVGYEYKTVKVPKEQESLWSDSMQNFGWELAKSESATVKHVWGPIRLMLAPLALIPGTPFGKMIRDHASETDVELTFKRDKHLSGKAELARLQSQFETSVRGIESLEHSKGSSATIAAYTIGLMGTVFMGISMFTYLAGSLPLMVIMAIPGFLGWILPYFVYKSLKGKKTLIVDPQIEKQHDSIYDICQKANGVLAGV